MITLPSSSRITAAAALRELPIAPIFSDFEDDVLFEVSLVSCSIESSFMKAYVLFSPRGADFAEHEYVCPPVMVPAHWFSALLPISIFLDIPNDVAILTPFLEEEFVSCSADDHANDSELGVTLAEKWRGNSRPVKTTIHYVARCMPHVPIQLMNLALDAQSALQRGSFTRSTRNSIALFCEMMTNHLLTAKTSSSPKE
jgi:hypothetical protein